MPPENSRKCVELVDPKQEIFTEGSGEGARAADRADPERNRGRKPNKRRWLCACCGSCCCLILIVVLVLIILAFTVFKPRDPRIHVDDITLEDFHGDIGLNLPPTIHLNVTLGLVVSVMNPNKAGFKYVNSTAHLFYRQSEVGIIPIPPGYIGPDGKQTIYSHLDLMADRIFSDISIIQDFLAGSLPFYTVTDISGRVSLLGIIHRHVEASARCDITVSISNRSTGYVCDYNVKL